MRQRLPLRPGSDVVVQGARCRSLSGWRRCVANFVLGAPTGWGPAATEVAHATWVPYGRCCLMVAVRGNGRSRETRSHEAPALPSLLASGFGGGHAVPTKASGRSMSQLLARLARTLSSHWKRSLAAAIGVLVLLVLAASLAGKPADDVSLPGTESQQAIDLFQAHSPAFGGADSTLVFTRRRGQDLRSRARRRRSRARWRRSAALDGVERRATRSARAGQVSPDGRLASVDVRYSTDPSAGREGRRRGADRRGRDRRAGGVQVAARGMLIDLATEQDAPVGELIGVLHRDRAAHPAVPLRGRDGRDADRRAGRRRGRPDPAGRARRAARPARVRGGDRVDARPRRRASTTRC